MLLLDGSLIESEDRSQKVDWLKSEKKFRCLKTDELKFEKEK